MVGATAATLPLLRCMHHFHASRVTCNMGQFMSGDVQLEIVADRPQAAASSGAGASLGDITAETTDSGGSGSPIPVVQAVVPAPPQVSAPTDPPAPKITFDEPASPPPAYGAASAPRSLQMDRANFDSKDFHLV